MTAPTWLGEEDDDLAVPPGHCPSCGQPMGDGDRVMYGRCGPCRQARGRRWRRW